MYIVTSDLFCWECWWNSWRKCLSEQLRRLKQEKARLLDTDSDDLADRTRDLMDALEDGPDFLDSFDAELFDALVEKIIVDSNECLRFRLKNGLELTEQIERTRR